jgi:hypothetical protein
MKTSWRAPHRPLASPDSLKVPLELATNPCESRLGRLVSLFNTKSLLKTGPGSSRTLFILSSPATPHTSGLAHTPELHQEPLPRRPSR